MQHQCFLVHWLCGGARAWLPDDWQIGLLTQVLIQADRQLYTGTGAWGCGVSCVPWSIRLGMN